MRKKRLIKRVLLLGLICVLSCVAMPGRVLADDGGEGHGADQGQVHTVTCQTAVHTRNVEQCSDKYGGASWHIFKRSNGVYVGNLNNARISPLSQVGVTYDVNHVDPLKGGGYDGRLNQECPASQYDYYMAYVYDGWNGKGLKGGPLFFGPVEWNVICPKKSGGGCNHPVYHTRSAHSYSSIVSAINSGTDVNAWRISGSRPWSKNDSTYRSADALKFYKDYNPGATKIPDIGYFCVSKKSYIGFQGRSEAGNKSIGYRYTSGTANTYFMNNCTNGCEVTFKHKVKKVKGAGKTNYEINRTSNLTAEDAEHHISSGSLKTGQSGNTNGETVYTETLTLYPGMRICETLTFHPYADNNTATTKVCAVALGKAQPEGDSAFLNIKVRNKERYKDYTNTVYAKPGDKVEYQATYSPKLQYTYYLRLDQMQIDGAPKTPYQANNTALGTIFTSKKTPGWNNAFSIRSENFTMSELPYTFSKGSSVTRTPDPNSYTVKASDAGKSLNEIAQLNNMNDTKTTPRQVTFTNASGKILANVSTAPSPSKASAKVPYNFTTDTTITSDNDKEVMYAGETFPVSYDYIIKPKYNSLTMTKEDRNYATSVGNPKWYLQVSVNHGSWTNTTEISKRNSDFDVLINEMFAGKSIKLTTKINVPDVPAGTDVCVRSVIYPATSGLEDNLNGDGDGKPRTSAEKCFKVAKKPSLQVWGGNVYTSGKITTAVSEKGLLAGTNYPPYKADGDTGSKHVFGSWGELGVISNAAISKFASGASTGYPLGSENTKFCERVPLTFANSPCKNDTVGVIGSSAAQNGAADDKDSIINKLMTEDVYKYSDGDLTIDEGVIAGDGEVKVIYAKRNITINQSITYSGSYTDLTRLPKVVVYGKNIVIGCGVTRIDALLIADEKVVTCNNIDGNLSKAEENAKEHINERPNSNQLTINGAIVTKTLVANRTYGAASGADSVTPAEIIDFDPTLYLWGTANNGDGSGSGDNKLEVTYLHELAPRR